MATLSYVSKNTNGAPGGGAATFTGQSIGTAAADRTIIVVAAGTESGSSASTPTCTIGGNSATRDVNVNGGVSSGGNRMLAAIFSLPVASGTTANITVNFNVTMFDIEIFVYAAYGLSGVVTATNTATGNTGTSSTLDVNVLSGGVIIGVDASYQHASSSVDTWTGLTQDDLYQLYSGSNFFDAASTVALSTQSPRSISLSFTNNANVDASFGAGVVSYEPSAAAPATRFLSLMGVGT